MTDHETRLRQLLACYGCDVKQWPQDARSLWNRAKRDSKLAHIIEDEKEFEHTLRRRTHPMASRDFADRIITASLERTQIMENQGWFSELLGEVRPAALAAMLVLGFAVGFGMLTHAHTTSRAEFVKTYSDDEGTIL